mgnify:CR=1 FL=1
MAKNKEMSRGIICKLQMYPGYVWREENKFRILGVVARELVTLSTIKSKSGYLLPNIGM